MSLYDFLKVCHAQWTDWWFNFFTLWSNGYYKTCYRVCHAQWWALCSNIFHLKEFMVSDFFTDFVMLSGPNCRFSIFHFKECTALYELCKSF